MGKTISLRAARVNAGMSLKVVSAKTGKTSKTISSWEKGLTPISAVDFNNLCKNIYNIDPAMVEIPIVDDGEYDE